MRLMEINKRTFYYCQYEGLREELDEYGNLTSENTPIYSDAVMVRANISEATGETQANQFGLDLDYDKVIALETTPITETSVLFVDKEPEFDDNGQPLYDYIVKRVSRTLNHVLIAIKKVDVS